MKTDDKRLDELARIVARGGGASDGEVERIASAPFFSARVRARVEAERKSDRFFIAGDFNSLPGSPVYKYLVGQPGYKDPFAHVYRMTDNELKQWPTAGFMRLRMHLDHIFTGPMLKWIDFDETHPFGDRACVFHGLSDHMPIIGRCRATAARESLRPRAISRPPE